VSKGRGYQLPDGDAFEEELRCALVFYPARDEYLYALGGSLDYLGTWIAWERDTLKRGQDAARAWKIATELTRECWTMNYCDEILTTLHSIERLLSEQSCCGGDTTTIGDIITTTTVIVPGEGDAPAAWGETAVADWDEWLEYVCYYAHKFVDDLISSAETLDVVAEIGSWTIEFFANVLRVMQFLTLVYPVSYAAVLAIKESFQSAGDMSDSFDNIATKLEAGRETIVCAVINGTSLADAVEAVIDDTVLWDILYQFNNYDSTQALIYEGTVDGSVYLPPVKRGDCDCPVPDGYSWQNAEEITFQLDADTFGRVNEASVSLPEITLGGTVATSGSWGCANYPAGVLWAKFVNDTYQTLAVRFTVVSYNGSGTPAGPLIDNDCFVVTPGYRRIRFYTLDNAGGIDAAWAATQCDSYRVEAGGHAKRAIGYEWTTGQQAAQHNTPGTTGVLITLKIEHLVWNE